MGQGVLLFKNKQYLNMRLRYAGHLRKINLTEKESFLRRIGYLLDCYGSGWEGFKWDAFRRQEAAHDKYGQSTYKKSLAEIDNEAIEELKDVLNYFIMRDEVKERQCLKKN